MGGPGARWGAGPEPAGETVSSRGDDGGGYFGSGPAGPERVNRGSIIPLEPLLHEAEAERTLMGGRGRSPLKNFILEKRNPPPAPEKFPLSYN